MMIRTRQAPYERITRPVTTLLVASLLSPVLLIGCGNNAPPAPRDATSGEMGRMNPAGAPTKQGMTTKKKLVLLAGAAALYYLYKKNQARVAAGQTQTQYYLSKNGRIYYRDPKTHQAIWVTPPKEPIYVPADQASTYEGLQGYDGSPTGRDLNGLVPRAPSNY